MLFFFSACQENEPNFSWLEGSWRHSSGMIEQWEKESTGWRAQVYELKSDATKLTRERITIRKEGGEWILGATVIGQNNDQEVIFRITEYSAKHFLAENPKHDFPQELSYKRSGANVLQAFVGKEKVLVEMRRVNSDKSI